MTLKTKRKLFYIFSFSFAIAMAVFIDRGVFVTESIVKSIFLIVVASTAAAALVSFLSISVLIKFLD
jgi:hypothetical protein